MAIDSDLNDLATSICMQQDADVIHNSCIKSWRRFSR
eukprot:CAMPEP_0197676762 /NCGR_PEP_ID=MMETSP1338-20131121/87327_1 /TAXON_ID=43686 ORGANISM="Pelagodinium beii, Strain RCC1491" /NCGR_SAMPLE_ID=MMETSP1338 /ASSEMBLY_ACC=CAM_ASM_000754 /LENGTH=36 /DNA_ID= /DNA_START= /DNA_END= /DNA_ORIENTATION=